MKQKLKIFPSFDTMRIVWTCDWVAEDETTSRHAQGGSSYECIDEEARQFPSWRTRAESFKLASAAAKRHWENFHEVEEDPLERPTGEPGQAFRGPHPHSYWGGKFGVMFWKRDRVERIEIAGPFKTQTDAQTFGRRVAPFRYKLTTLHTPERYIERLERMEREEGLREERRLRRIGDA